MFFRPNKISWEFNFLNFSAKKKSTLNREGEKEKPKAREKKKSNFVSDLFKISMTRWSLKTAKETSKKVFFPKFEFLSNGD